MKLCTKCNEEKSLDNFYNSELAKISSRCIQCIAEYQKTRKGKSNQTANLKFNYNISLEEFVKLKIQQNYSCKICLISESELKKSLCVDHDHPTGKVRGLLCSPCNMALGLFKDKPLSLVSAAKYLLENTHKD